MYLKKIIKSFVFFVLALITLSSFANNSPVDVLQSTANKIIAQLQSKKADLRTNPKISYSIVNQFLVPLVDQDAMAQAVLGRSVWNNATASQKKEFISQFRILVVRTYAAAIAQFTNESIQFFPIRGDLNGQSIVTVKSQIIRTNAPNVPVSYSVVASGHSWKVIDFSVDGISMVQSFKSQFQNELSAGGLDHLIASLQAHNAKNG